MREEHLHRQPLQQRAVLGRRAMPFVLGGRGVKVEFRAPPRATG